MEAQVGQISRDVALSMRSLSESPFAEEFARAVGPVYRSLERIAIRQQEIEERMATGQQDVLPNVITDVPADGLQEAQQNVTAGLASNAPMWRPEEYVPPPGAGIGPGATPPGSAASLSPMEQTQLVPAAPGTVNISMDRLVAKYHIDKEDANHVAWLLSAGLIRDVDVEGVILSLGVRERQSVLTPRSLAKVHEQMRGVAVLEDVASQTSPNVMLPEMPVLALPGPPVPALPPMPKKTATTSMQRSLAAPLALPAPLVPLQHAAKAPASWGGPRPPATEHFDIASQPDEGAFQSPPPRPAASPVSQPPPQAARDSRTFHHYA